MPVKIRRNRKEHVYSMLHILPRFVVIHLFRTWKSLLCLHSRFDLPLCRVMFFICYCISVQDTSRFYNNGSRPPVFHQRGRTFHCCFSRLGLSGAGSNNLIFLAHPYSDVKHRVWCAFLDQWIDCNISGFLTFLLAFTWFKRFWVGGGDFQGVQQGCLHDDLSI